MLRRSRWLRRRLERPLTRRCAALSIEDLENRVVPTLLGQQLFPSDYPWNQDISNAPVATNSAAVISHIGSSIGIHPDWGEDSPSNGTSSLYGIPINVVHGNSTAKINVIIDNYPGESDVVPAPVPANAVIEGDFQNGPNLNGGGYNTGQRGDSHLLIWDQDTNTAYEFYGTTRPSDPTIFPNTNGTELPHTDGRWHAAQESVWHMTADSFRTLADTSADAAGLSILAGLARPDEGLPAALGGQGAIRHALRFTLPSGDVSPQYIYPASHVVGTSAGSTKLPFGARLRLMNTPAVNQVISTLGPEAQIIAHAMQQYGLVLADIGSAMYVTGSSASGDASNPIQLTWDMNDVLGLHALKASSFEVVDLTPQVTGLSKTTAAGGSSITVVGRSFSGSAGHLTVLFGNTPASSVTYVDDSHINVVVPNGSGTVHVRVQSGVNLVDPNNPANNVTNPIFGYGISTTSAADQFTFNNFTVNPTASTDSFATSFDVAGTADVLTLVITDTNGNPVSGLASGAFTLNLSGGTSAGVFGSVTETATRGTYQTTFTGATAGTANTLTVTVAGVALANRPSLTVMPAAPALFALAGLPTQLSAGTIATVTLTARDAFGNLATGYQGTVHFTSSDSGAVLPANYSFTAGDAGVHAFTIELVSTGTQSITVADVGQPALTIARGNIAVLAFPFVSAQGAAIRGAKNQALSGLVATFATVSGQSASNFTATIDWGDGQSSSGVVQAGSGGGFTVAGTHTYAATGAFTVRTTIHSQAGTSQTITSQASIGTADQFFVMQLYSDLLGRPADAGGLAAWSGALDQGTATRQQVAAAFVSSQEFRANEVTNLYQTILGRSADATGLQSWLAFLAQGHTALDVEAQLYGSTEFFSKSGGNNAGFLASLFADVLHRQVDPTGAAALGQELAGGTSTLMVAQQVLASQEAGAVAITSLYQPLLHRSPDAGGLQAFLTQLLHRGTEQITIALAGSQEYAQNCHGDADLYYVQNLYTDLLNRPLDVGGQATFVNGLDNGQWTRSQIVQALLASNEYRSGVVNRLYQTYLQRPADPSSLSTFIAFLANGGTDEQLAALLTGSAEFFNDSGGTNAGFINGLYRNALGRAPDAAGLAFWLSALQNGVGRGQVATAIFGSAEYQSDLVQAFYPRFLHRPADNGGLSLFVAALQNGARDEAIIAALIGSIEYFTR